MWSKPNLGLRGRTLSAETAEMNRNHDDHSSPGEREPAWAEFQQPAVQRLLYKWLSAGLCDLKDSKELHELLNWSDPSHTRLLVTGIKYHTTGCVALWKRVSAPFLVDCLCFCAMKCQSRLCEMTKPLALSLLEDFCTFMIKQPLNPLRCCFNTLLFHRCILGGLPF